MSEDYRKKEGKDLVQYVADATTLGFDDCKKILSVVCQKDVDAIDAEELYKLSEKSYDKFLKKKLRERITDGVEDFMEEVGKCRKVLGFARSLTYQNYLVINDPIHGTIELHPLLVKIIDCPLFQRLRHIKQLGGVSYVYPGATHTRFEHSIGVCHLAGEVMKNLMTKQPELGITYKDVLCVQIAGLCHDLGHGPFSHMFEWVAKEIRKGKRPKWEHEKISCKALDTLINEESDEEGFEKESVKEAFERFGLNIANDIPFVKDIFQGKARGREEKGYLLKVVANKDSGCDVDKWDYFARDCYYLGIPCDFDFSRFVKGIRVVPDPHGTKQLCFRDKEVNNVYGMFRTRGNLHQKALQHKTSQVIQRMMYEALLSAKDVPVFGQGDAILSLEDVVNKAAENTDLSESGWKDFDDRFLLLILNSNDDRLTEAQRILRRIEKREIYKYLGCAYVKRDQCTYFHKEYGKENLKELVQQHHGGSDLTNLRVLTAVISQSSESKTKPDKDPVESVKFYKKEDPTTIVLINLEKVSTLVKPTAFSETCLQVYDTEDDDTCGDCWRAFKNWADTKNVFEPIEQDPERYPTISLGKRARRESCKIVNYDERQKRQHAYMS